jgi:hypothetical protein
VGGARRVVVGDQRAIDRYDHAHPGVHDLAVAADQFGVPSMVEAGKQVAAVLENAVAPFLPEMPAEEPPQ